MADRIPPIPDKADADAPDAIATPEGDGEFDPQQPLRPLPDGALEDPRGNAPAPYERDHQATDEKQANSK